MVLGAFAALGPPVVALGVPISIFLGLIFAGVAAHKNQASIPFWKCTVVYTLLFFWGTSWHTGPPSNEELVFTAFVFATGVVLSFSSIRDGHWATKIMGTLVFLPIAWFIGSHIFRAYRNWSDVVRYWYGANL